MKIPRFLGFRIFRKAEGRSTKTYKQQTPLEVSGYARYIRPPIMPLREKPKGEVVERYSIYDPWAMAFIILSEDTGEYIYYVDEVPLTEDELRIYRRVVDFLMWEAGELKEGEDPREFISREARKAVDLFRIRMGRTPSVSWSKILYYIEREIAGFGAINTLMMDPNLEDISCNGVGIPIYVYHRKYESMPTNIVFNTSEELDSFVIKLAHMAGKHISVAFPILDASLPGGHRLAATFMREVSQKGSTFTIRKFREDPITIVDMIGFGTVSPLLAAYLWMAIEYKRTILIMGVTGSGKTTLLNSILNLVKPNYKIVTIEDTPEIRLPTKNWVQLVARPSYAAGESRAGEISLYDLVRVSLRYRPDIIVVGEVRGAEAYVLFQSIATGHGGATTIHAESIDAAIKRLTSPPMNIPESYIPLINIALMIERVSIRDREGRARATRRVTRVWEISREGVPIPIGRWSPSKDIHDLVLENSEVTKSIAGTAEVDVKAIYDEISRRAMVMRWLYHKGIRNYKDIASVIYRYYRDPQSVLERAEADLRAIEDTTPGG
ncbi:MAG: type II/IV secretion system ATPase subunit [Sulfolobales archaeon]